MTSFWKKINKVVNGLMSFYFILFFIFYLFFLFYIDKFSFQEACMLKRAKYIFLINWRCIVIRG
jgi:hypothetical protein